jgi:serine/threonine-protein kinase
MNLKEDLLLALAVEKGLITEQEIPNAVSNQDASNYGSRINSLIQSRRLSVETIESLIAQLHATEAFDALSDSSPAVISWDAFFDGWDKYQVQGLIGQGGMARVYKAYEPALNRFVALKFLRENERDQIRRFLREARSQAHIEHDHVCQVYEAGERKGQPYISMQFVDGQPLHQISASLTLEAKALIMQQVAEAVNAAHRLGMIHRDLKPGNILVERKPEGQLHAYVVDFGLAREIAKDHTTVAGSFLGTPAYMSPEQAAGLELDRRSDIYSLGATFYHLLSGAPPFEMTGREFHWKTYHREPVPLRNKVARIPKDLETIVMKCLESDPSKRYDSARALADDLKFYLEGEPIRARPSSLLYTVLKKIKRHRVASIVAAISFILIAGFAAIAIRTQLQSESEVEAAREMTRFVQEMEWRMRVAFISPLKDIRPERNRIRETIRKIGVRAKELGSPAQGAGLYAQGRGYLLLAEYPAALKSLTASYDAGYHNADIQYALGLTNGMLYIRGLEDLVRISDSRQRERKRKEIKNQYLRPALNHLRNSGGASVEAPEYPQGLIAFYEGRNEQAIRLSNQALQKVWWLYEAKKLEGDVYRTIALAHQSKGDYTAAVNHYQKAGASYDDAIAIARSDPGLYESQCSRLLQLLQLEIEMGKALPETLNSGLKSCDSSLIADPDSAAAHAQKARLYWRWGEDQLYMGNDPRLWLDQSIESARAALHRSPTHFNSLMELGTAFDLKGEYELTLGVDPRSSQMEAISSFKKASALDPANPWPYSYLGLALWNRSKDEMNRGLDPLPNLKDAITNYSKAVELRPDLLMALTNLGNTHLLKAQHETVRGGPAGESLNLAIDSYKKALSINPNYPAIIHNQGLACLYLANFELTRGIDPSGSLSCAVENAEKTLKIDPEFAPAYQTIGSSHLAQAKMLHFKKRDPFTDLEKAEFFLKKSLDMNIYDAGTTAGFLADVYLFEARSLLEMNRNPFPAFGKVDRLIERIEKQKWEPPAYKHRAVLSLLKGKYALQKGESAEAHFAEGCEAAETGTKKEPFNTVILLTHAEILKRRAEFKKKQKSDFRPDSTKAAQLLQKAIELNPESADAWLLQKEILLFQSEADSARSASLLQQAKAAEERALKLNPMLSENTALKSN